MKIGIISDTHISKTEEDVPAIVYEHFANIDMILHAGDIYRLEFLDRLSELAPVVAVAGNGDEYRGINDPRLVDSRVFTVGGLRIGMRHSIVYPEGPPVWTLEGEMERYFGGPVDIIVFGHSHIALVETCKEVLIINPGSATLPRNLRWQPGTIAILEILGRSATASIINLA